MEEKRRKRRDFWQNIAITLLTLSAVFLFAQTQLYRLGADRYAGLFSASSAQTDAAGSWQAPGLSAPVRIAVSGNYGRYASVNARTDSAAFSSQSRVLSEAIGSAGELQPCTAEDFRAALNGTAVYYDFLNPLPLSVLAGLNGVAVEDEETLARSLVAAAVDGGVELHLWDGKETYLHCDTAVSAESLQAAVNQFDMGSARFAYEDANAGHLNPYTLLLQDAPELPAQKESIPAVSVDMLLEALQFNPRTNYRYAETEGTEVIVEGGRSLRIYADGTISYQSGGEEVLTVEAANTTLEELTAGCSKLLEAVAAAVDGQASIYLESIRREENTVTLAYGYEVDGVPVRYADGLGAGSITLTGTAVSGLEIRLRQYTAAESKYVLIPSQQAVAIAGQYDKTELFIGYAGDGTGKFEAKWLME